MGIFTCNTCGKLVWFSDECSECEKKRLDKWMVEHTFKEGEKVESLYNKNFYNEPRYATVIDKRRRIEGSWGYYDEWTEYKIRFDNGEELWQPAEELCKAKENAKNY